MKRWTIFGAVSWLALLFFIPLLLLNPTSSTSSISISIAPLIQSNQQKGRFMQALYQVELQAARFGWTPAMYLTAGDLWQQAGDLTRALPYWEAAAQAGISAVDRQLAQTYLDLQQWPDAADALSRLIERDSENRWAHFQLGLIRAAFDARSAETHLRLAARTPEYGEVSAAVLNVLLANPSDPLGVGVALADARLWSYAELAFQQAADMGQSYARALAYTGLARDRQGKNGAVWMQQAVENNPQDSVVRYLQGLHLRVKRDYQGSLEAFIQAVALDPQNPALYAELGIAYRLVYDLVNAERWLKIAVDVSNEDPRFQQMLDQFYAEQTSNIEAILQRLAEKN